MKQLGEKTERLSITWSNTHQKLLNKALTEAMEQGRLTVTSNGKFQVSQSFFDHESTKGFLDSIPKETLENLIAAWIEKRTGQKT